MLEIFDILASLVFATTGALVASRKQMDLVGFIWLGVITGVGGGTVRDLLLGIPVFWVKDATPIIACLAGSIGVYFFAHLIQSRYKLLLWLDAAGLALVTIAGTTKGIDLGVSPVIGVAMGIITGSIGGIIRDILGQEPSIVLRREIYVTASLAGAILFVILNGIGIERPVATITGILLVFIIRVLAILFNWTLPTYNARPGRKIDQ